MSSIATRKTIPLLWAAHFTTSRMRAGWRSRLTIIASVLLTTVIGAMSPLYTSLVAQAGMVNRLELQASDGANINTRIGLTAPSTMSDAVLTTLDNSVRQTASAAFEPIIPNWLSEVVVWGESAPMFVVRDGSDIPDLKLKTAYYQGWENRVQVLEGELPPPNDRTAIGAISPELADRFDLAIGDVITLDQRGWETSQSFSILIAAIVIPEERGDSYWMSPSPLRLDSARSTAEANILVTRESLFSTFNNTPDASAVLGWRFLFDHDALAFGRISQATEQVSQFESALSSILGGENGFSLNFRTQLPAILTNYTSEINLLKAPFGVLMLQLASLMLFFLLIMASLAQRSEQYEVAMLQGRGALESQIILLRALEGAVICFGCVLVAPFIARQLLVWIAPVLIGANLPMLELDAQSFLYAALIGILAWGVLIISLRPVLKLPLISAGGSAIRPPRQAWWQRYYLDVLLVVVGTAALFRLLATNSPFAQSLLGGLGADPLLLVAPALLFIALGSLTLRLFPLLTDIAARFAAKNRGAAATLATWSVSRDPAYYARLAFLLALAIGIGWFAISFQATLTQSYEDQAFFSVGADARLSAQDLSSSLLTPAMIQSLAESNGVNTTTNTLRVSGINMALDGLRITPGEFLAVDSGTFARTAYWRDDLGELKLPVPSSLPETGAFIPFGASRMGVWLRLWDIQIDPQTGQETSRLPLIWSLFNETSLFARFQTPDRSYVDIHLTPQFVENVPEGTDLTIFNLNVFPFADPALVQEEIARLQAALEDTSGWIYFEAAIDSELQDELKLEMLYLRTDFRSNWTPAVLHEFEVGGLTFLNDENLTLVADLLTRSDWSLMIDNPATIQHIELSPASNDKGPGQIVTLSQSQPRAIFGIALYPPAPPIPAVISEPLAEQYALEPGVEFTLTIDNRQYTFVLEDTTLYFPTLYVDQSPFVVADLNALTYALNRRPVSIYYPNEVLIDLSENTDARTWVKMQPVSENPAATTFLIADHTRAVLSGDVLMRGLSRLLLMASVISLVLSMLGLGAYAALSAQNRRFQFAVLRALGVSSQRIAISVVFEQVVVFGVALLLGTVMGLLLSVLVLPTLAISTSGRAITPPFMIEMDANAILQYVTVLIGILILVLFATIWLIRRMALGETLRY